jgi:hypothetical protein
MNTTTYDDILYREVCYYYAYQQNLIEEILDDVPVARVSTKPPTAPSAVQY